MVLSFSMEARRQFDPVAKKFGLICVHSSEAEVRYENAKVFLEINYDINRSYELDVGIGRQNSNDFVPSFSLAEILRLRGAQEASFASGLVVSDETQLIGILSKLARLTFNYASDFLGGKDLSFAQVKKLRDKEGSEYELASQLRHARSSADAAWHARDYDAVVRALEALELYLTSAEKKRLEYSRKQLDL